MDSRSPSNVDVASPCLKQPLSLFHANAEDSEEEGNDEDADESNADQ